MSEYPLGTSARAIRVARDEIGIVEKPVNKVKYNDDNGLAWCGYFIDWILPRAGVKGTPSQISTSLGAHKMKEIGRWVDGKPQPGDLIYLGWGAKGEIQHIGIVCEVADKYVVTIEGNTSDTNQANGGAVMVKVRQLNENVIGFSRPKYVPFKGEFPKVEIPAASVVKPKKKGLLKK
jgi:cell wall-associated NlpC family hydrolase